jgi:anti-sigma regulatory factor (Ser/Thr protein kinase)
VKANGRMVTAHDISELQSLREELRLYLQRRALPADVTYDLLTCVQEACMNALRFAASPRGVRAWIVINSNEVVATVRDYGGGLAPAVPVICPEPDAYCESGRGLFLMVELMDRVEFRVAGGTQVRLHKLLPAHTIPEARVA